MEHLKTKRQKGYHHTAGDDSFVLSQEFCLVL